MRKVLLLALVLAVSVWAAPGVLLELEPTVPGVPSKARIVGSRGTADSANSVIQYEYENWTYYFPYGEEDSIVVWFEPPAKCTLCAIRTYWYTNWTDEYEYDLTAAFTAPGTQLTDWQGFNTGNTGPSPTGTVLWHKVDTSPPAAGGWDMVEIPWSEVPDVVDSSFIVKIGHMGTDSFATLGDEVREPPPNHSLVYSNPTWIAGIPIGWYSHYYAALGIRAYVKAYENVAPKVISEELPYTYYTGARPLYVYGFDFGPDSSGVVLMTLYYSVNGGTFQTLTTNTPVDGGIDEGIWEFDVPGVSVGDTVDYYVIGEDWLDAADTSGPFTYEILAGTPGHFLYMINDDDPADILPEYYTDIVDVWVPGAYGDPDSSVLCFYANGTSDTSKTIVWRDWGCLPLGPGSNYGLGGFDADFSAVSLLHSDSSWIKLLLDNGGHFWLSDEDQGYGLGICPDYGQQGVPSGHWVREYLGIKGMNDDGPLAGDEVVVFGDPSDPVIGDLFTGIGHQTSGQVFILPSSPWIGNYDSLAATAVTNMFAMGGEVISYRYTGPSETYKVYNDFWPIDYIRNPADSTVDQVAVDSLVEDVLVWFGFDRSGISDRTVDPGKVVKLLPVGIVTNEAMIKFSVPRGMVISLDIYDNTGRLVKNLVNGKVSAGLHTVRWNANVANGVYFYRLKAGDKRVSNKMVVIR